LCHIRALMKLAMFIVQLDGSKLPLFGRGGGTVVTNRGDGCLACTCRLRKSLTGTAGPRNRGGRPRGSGKSHYPEIFQKELGSIPDDPLERCEWAQAALCIAMRETLQGRGNRIQNQELRSFVRMIVSSIPTERLAEAERQIRNAMKARRKPGGATGPPIEPVDEKPTENGRRPPLRR
jgi:hypothetical protein